MVTTGPYAYVRHPMYASVILIALGVPLLLGSWWGLLAVAAASSRCSASARRAGGADAQGRARGLCGLCAARPLPLRAASLVGRPPGLRALVKLDGCRSAPLRARAYARPPAALPVHRPTASPQPRRPQAKPDPTALEQASTACKESTREKGIKSVLAIVDPDAPRRG